MVTVQQYREAVRVNRRWDYCILAATVYMVAVMVVGGVLLGTFGDSWAQECGQWVIRHDLSHADFGLITCAVCLPIGLFVAAPTILLLRLGDRQKRRDRRLVCPHCNAFLNVLVMLTGNCCRCGAQALDISTLDSGAAESGHRLFTVSEFNTAVRNLPTLRDPKGHDPRIRCRRCQMELTQRRFILVATRKSSYCLAVVLEDPESVAGENDTRHETQMLTLAKYRKMNLAYFRCCMFGAVILFPCFSIA